MTTIAKQDFRYLQGYAPETLAQIEKMRNEQRLGDWLKNRYPEAHTVRTDKALFEYMQALKQEHLRGAEPLNKVAYDSKLHVVQHALGTHTTISRVQGSKLKAKREIRIATLFKDVPADFLKMIAVHELAHIKERHHDKPFYQLCTYMELQFYYVSETVDS